MNARNLHPSNKKISLKTSPVLLRAVWTTHAKRIGVTVSDRAEYAEIVNISATPIHAWFSIMLSLVSLLIFISFPYVIRLITYTNTNVFQLQTNATNPRVCLLTWYGRFVNHVKVNAFKKTKKILPLQHSATLVFSPSFSSTLHLVKVQASAVHTGPHWAVLMVSYMLFRSVIYL